MEAKKMSRRAFWQMAAAAAGGLALAACAPKTVEVEKVVEK